MSVAADHVCTGACAPDFHPSVPPANEYGRAPADPAAYANAERQRRVPEHEPIAPRRVDFSVGYDLGCRCGACQAMEAGHI